MIAKGRCTVEQGDVSNLRLAEGSLDLATALKKAGFSETRAVHHKSKPWITVVARK